MNENKYIKIEDLEIYKVSCELSNLAWKVFNRLDSEGKYILGRQFITAVDSIGANIAEGYGRFHYLDRVRFCYNARGSLSEVKHWLRLLKERSLLNEDEFNRFGQGLENLNIKLNSYIKSILDKKPHH